MSKFVSVHAVQVDLQTQFECFGQQMHLLPAWLRCLVSGNGMVLWFELIAGNPNSRRVVTQSFMVHSGVGCVTEWKKCSLLAKHYMFLRRQSFGGMASHSMHLFVDRLLDIFYEWPVGMHGMRAGLFKGTPSELCRAVGRTIHTLNLEASKDW